MPPDRVHGPSLVQSVAREPTSFKAGDSHLIAANHVHERKCQCAEPSVSAGGTVVKREAQDAYQTAARVRTGLLEDAPRRPASPIAPRPAPRRPEAPVGAQPDAAGSPLHRLDNLQVRADDPVTALIVRPVGRQ
jgi:hypothetical protein